MIGLVVLTLLITAILATLSKISNQIPMSWARSAIGRLTSHTNLSESIRISKMLLASAKKGAKGNAATKIVMKPNWRTLGVKKKCELTKIHFNSRNYWAA